MFVPISNVQYLVPMGRGVNCLCVTEGFHLEYFAGNAGCFGWMGK